MGTFKDTLRIMVKRPFIILFFGLMTLAYCVVNSYNPILSILFGFNTISTGDAFKGIISFLKLLISIIINPGVLIIGILLLVVFLIFVSIIMGVVFSGYLNIINNTLEGKPKFKGEFLFGIKKYFSKISLLSFKALALSIVFVIFMMISTVPAVVITKACVSGKTELVLAALMIDFITAAVVFFGFMFFRIYMLYWYFAAVNLEKKAFTVGKRVADSHFWKVVGKFIVFDIIFIIIQSMLLYFDNLVYMQTANVSLFAVAVFIGNWLFKTLFFSFFITYNFSTFKHYREGRKIDHTSVWRLER